MREFKIVTVCNRFPTEPYYCLNEFIKSLGDHKPLVLGTQQNEYLGLGSKPKLLYKAIKDGLIDTEFTLFTDCFDAVFQGDPQMVYQAWLSEPYKDAEIVISAERNCFPDDVRDQYDKLNIQTSFKYLNSGFIFGRTEAILAALEAMDLPNVPDDYRNEDGSMTHINDQSLWQHLFLKQPVKMALDTKTIFSNALHSMTLDELDFSGNWIKNKETLNSPCMLHLNGSAKSDGLREPVLKHLNLI